MYMPKSSIGYLNAEESRNLNLRINQKFPKRPKISHCGDCGSKFPSTGRTGEFCYKCYIKYLEDLEENGTHEDKEHARRGFASLHNMTNYIRRVLELQKLKIVRNRLN